MIEKIQTGGVGPLVNCEIHLELFNSYWPELDLPDDEDEDETEYCCFCGGETADDYSTCTCDPIEQNQS